MEYKSFYKVAGGGERIRCRYNARLDSYGCGCSHDCGYCYAKSLLEFRKLWHPEAPSVADIHVSPGSYLRASFSHTIKSTFDGPN